MPVCLPMSPSACLSPPARPSLEGEDLLLCGVQLLLRAVQHLLRLLQLELQSTDGLVLARNGLTHARHSSQTTTARARDTRCALSWWTLFVKGGNEELYSTQPLSQFQKE